MSLVMSYDGNGFVGLLDTTKNFYYYTLNPDVIKENKYYKPNYYRNKFLLHGLPRAKNKKMLGSIEHIIFEEKWREFLGRNTRRPITPGERKMFFACRDKAKAYVNGLVYKAIQTADPAALRIARRFHVDDRRAVYDSCVLSDKLKQLFDIDPVLAFIIVLKKTKCINPIDRMLGDDCIKMIENNVKLKNIYKHLGLPSTIKNLKPGIFNNGEDSFSIIDCIYELKNANINFNHLPKTTIKQQRLFSAIHRHHLHKIWLCKNLSNEVLDRKKEEIISEIYILRDYMRQTETTNLYGVRLFNENMSYKTVKRNSDIWHNRYNRNVHGFWDNHTMFTIGKPQEEKTIFPPWLGGDWKTGNWEIVHIKNGPELLDEGIKMSHCVYSYFNEAKEGLSYFFSLKHKGERQLTIQVKLHNILTNRNIIKFHIEQALGKYNRKPTDKEKDIYYKWLNVINKQAEEKKSA